MNGNDLYEFEESRCWELGKKFVEENYELVKNHPDFIKRYWAMVDREFVDACAANEARAEVDR